MGFEDEFLIDAITDSGRDYLNADTLFESNLHCSVEIWFAKTTTDVKECANIILKSIVLRLEGQIFDLDIVLFAKFHYVNINIL